MAIIPGQWKVFTLDSGPVVVRSTDGDTEYMVARCYGDGDGDQISTATLIAAAPELLDVCRRLLQLRCMAGYTRDNCDDVAKAVAVINKAEGRGE